MPGLRAGWMMGPKDLTKHAESLSMCMLFGLPGFIQEAALTALKGSLAPEQRIRELCTARRDMLMQGLAGVRGIRCCVPEAGMFTLIDVRGTGLSGYDFMSGLFRSERVSVRLGASCGCASPRTRRRCAKRSHASAVMSERWRGSCDEISGLCNCRAHTRRPGGAGVDRA
jgi:aspartate/methionine/tyrosine aminotransferase